MNEFTREELEQIADTDNVQCGEASVLARMALAAMDSEPVGEFYEDGPLNWYQISEGDKVPDSRRIPLYRHAPPASVSVPDVIAPTVEAIKRVLPTSNPDEYAACIGADMWNACRAAMLQAGNSPVSQDGWMLVPKEPTMAMLDEFDSIIDHGAEDSKDAWSRLISAAPQQEVK